MFGLPNIALGTGMLPETLEDQIKRKLESDSLLVAAEDKSTFWLWTFSSGAMFFVFECLVTARWLLFGGRPPALHDLAWLAIIWGAAQLAGHVLMNPRGRVRDARLIRIELQLEMLSRRIGEAQRQE